MATYLRSTLLKIIKNKITSVLLPSIIFLIIGIWTLGDYGMNWDEPIHFMRGQAYLNYFLTGKKDYSNLSPYPRLLKKCPEKVKNCQVSPLGPSDTIPYEGNITYEEAVLKNVPKGQPYRSYYQHDNGTFNDFINMEEGHPPLGGILAALTNKIFYQHLKIIPDIESYHLFEVFAGFMIVAGVSIFVYKNYGVFPAFIAGSALGTYPLFFGESHFNIKDPILASFFGLALITFYFGVLKNKWKLLIGSAVISGLAMGVKFNIFFLPFIVVPWLILHYLNFYWQQRKKIRKLSDLEKIIPKSLFVGLAVYPLIIAFTFYTLWPFLWTDPINNFFITLKFYKSIGTGTPHELNDYLIKGWNTYAPLWILYTTPIPVLALALIGLVGSAWDFVFKRKVIFVLISLWLFVPILRVSYPGTSIYGGVRQIMEYIPAMAVLSGVGAYYLIKSLRGMTSKNMVKVLILASLIFVVSEIIRIHPNQNVYFNQLIGGLSGARERGIPYWGNSYGNVYQQGITWLNANAEPGAKLGFPVSTGQNLARVKLRPDIIYANSSWSGPNRGGEYEMELDFDWGPKEWYSYAYYDTFVEPAFVAQVDGVPLLKIWKNDLEHTRLGFREEVEYKYQVIKEKSGKGQLVLDLGQVVPLTRVVVDHSTNNCDVQKGGYMETSEDGITWKRDQETISAPQVPANVNGWDEDTFVFMFAARKGRYVFLDTQMENSCYLKNSKIKVQGLPIAP